MSRLEAFIAMTFVVIVAMLSVATALVIDTIWLDKESSHGQTVVAPKTTCLSDPSNNDPQVAFVQPHNLPDPVQKNRIDPQPTGTPTQPTNSTEIENPHAHVDGDDHGKGKGDIK